MAGNPVAAVSEVADGDQFAALMVCSTEVAQVFCPHPECGWPEAELATIYRKPHPVATDPFRYFLGAGNGQRRFRGSKALTLTSQVWLGRALVQVPATPSVIEYVVMGRRSRPRPGPWRIECHLCRVGPRFQLGSCQPVELSPRMLARLAEGLLASGPGPHRVPLPDLQRAITS